MDLFLDNCLVLMGQRLVPRQLLLSKGKIAAVSEKVVVHGTEKKIDCKGHVLLPGAIDSHVHFRYPGAEHKETWETGSRAAVAGGITTVIDMPNNSPACTTQERLDDKIRNAKRLSLCNFEFYIGATTDNLEELKKVEGAIGIKIFLGLSTGNMLLKDESKLKQVFEIAKQRDAVATIHGEDDDLLQENMESAKELGWNHVRYNSRIRSPEVEEKAVEKALRVQKEIGNKLHFLHITSKNSIELIKNAKREGKPVTCEVTPHHLFLDESLTEKIGNYAKMAPPLRSEEHRKALWKGIFDGTVDVIGTDHAPHTHEEKEQPYFDAPLGVPGCETMLPLLLNAVSEERLSLQRVVELCCKTPAKIFGLKSKGEIRNGMDADLVLVDLNGETVVKNGQLETKCGWSPFATWKLKGAVEKVFVKGKQVVK